jgi:hypothetical protein
VLARKDGKLERSVISQKKAVETKGATNTTPSPKTLKGAHDTTYDSQSFVTLRYSMLGTPQTFEETFFIVKACQPDVLLRHNIEKESLKSEPGCYPNSSKDPSIGKKSRSRKWMRTSSSMLIQSYLPVLNGLSLSRIWPRSRT